MKPFPRPNGLLAGAVMLAASSMTVPAAELPRNLAVTAYDVGSSGYSQAVAVGAAFKNNLGVTLRVLPGKNDVSRLIPLREGKVDFTFNGIGTYFAQEGVGDFGGKGWGPQQTRLLLMSMGDNCATQFVAADAGVKTLADLKGKRLVHVRGAPGLNHNAYAHLRFGGLTWDDVQQVEVGGNAAAFEAIVNDQADSFFSVTNSGSILKVQNSPRGIRFPPLPHDDEAAWARLLEVAPYFVKHVCRESAGNLPPWEAGTFPYPLITSYADDDADLAYAITEAMFAQYPNYKDSAPAASGYALEKQVLDWVVPFHEGAIRFYKEAGKWTPEIQAHNDRLVARQQALQESWKGFLASNPPADGEAFTDAWMAARHAGMEKAGHNPIWKTFK